jgi:hypothetical protein
MSSLDTTVAVVAEQSNFIITLIRTPEIVAAIISLLISALYSHHTRKKDRAEYHLNLSSERAYQKDLYYYQTIVLHVYDLISVSATQFNSLITECVEELNKSSVQAPTAKKRKLAVESQIEKIDAINKTVEHELFTKARVVSEGFSTELTQMWSDHYDEAVRNTTTLTIGKLDVQSKKVLESSADTHKAFVDNLVKFIRKQHPTK